MNTYRVNVTRDGRWYMLSIPEIDGLTQARWRWEIKRMARSCIAVTLDVPMREVAVDVHYEEAA